MADEKITANEWETRRKCPICADIADKKINLDGEVQTHPSTGEPLACPMCDYPETKLFHKVVIESKRTGARGDTQPWNHLFKVECDSCNWSHVVQNYVCLGEPWDEVFGFKRKLEQTDNQEHAIAWSNEQAVGLRGGLDKYKKEDELLGRGYRAARKITTEKTAGQGKIEWIPTNAEKKLPKFRDVDES